MAGNRGNGGRGGAQEGGRRPEGAMGRDDRKERAEAVAGLLGEFASLSPEAGEAFLCLARGLAEGRISPDGAGEGDGRRRGEPEEPAAPGDGQGESRRPSPGG